MDNKFYVSYEAEKLLIEKGYPIEKDTPIYNEHGGVIGCYHADRPTKSEAIDWLDSKEVYIQIGGVGSGATQKWSYSVFDYKTCDNYASDYIFLTRLEAEEAAIIKALKLLNGKEE